jgi:Spy/CpxP family protein refolding chaperone
MRAICKLSVLGLVLAVATGSAMADDDQGNKGKRPPKPKVQVRPGAIQLVRPAGVFGGRNATNLARLPQVQKELKLTDEQTTKIAEINKSSSAKMGELYKGLQGLKPQERKKKYAELNKKRAEATKASQAQIKKVLTDEQKTRLEQISVQQQGVRALLDEEIAGKLKVTDKQQAAVTEAFASQQKKQRQLFQDIRNGVLQREDYAKKSAEIREETNKAAVNSLTDEQKKQFEAMKGEKFELKFNRARIRPKAAAGKAGIKLQIAPAGNIKGVKRIRIQAVPKKK